MQNADRPETTTGPLRIQRRRSKGWRMPEGAVYVGRGSRWGNPFVVGLPANPTAADCVRRFRCEQVPVLQASLPNISALRGHDLACWCPLDQPCHADVLLEIANG